MSKNDLKNTLNKNQTYHLRKMESLKLSVTADHLGNSEKKTIFHYNQITKIE